ncbi:hypothetical protein PG984_011318 [Apiospora sp. TS-2023a]
MNFQSILAVLAITVSAVVAAPGKPKPLIVMKLDQTLTYVSVDKRVDAQEWNNVACCDVGEAEKV